MANQMVFNHSSCYKATAGAHGKFPTDLLGPLQVSQDGEGVVGARVRRLQVQILKVQLEHRRVAGVVDVDSDKEFKAILMLHIPGWIDS